MHYQTAEAAQEAINMLHGKVIEGQEVSVSHFMRRVDRAGQAEWTNLYVKGKVSMQGCLDVHGLMECGFMLSWDSL